MIKRMRICDVPCVDHACPVLTLLRQTGCAGHHKNEPHGRSRGVSPQNDIAGPRKAVDDLSELSALVLGQRVMGDLVKRLIVSEPCSRRSRAAVPARWPAASYANATTCGKDRRPRSAVESCDDRPPPTLLRYPPASIVLATRRRGRAGRDVSLPAFRPGRLALVRNETDALPF